MYILDSDTMTYYVKGLSDHLRYMINEKYSQKICTTIINYSEIKYGIFKSKKNSQNLMGMNFLISNISKLPLTIESANIFGELKARLTNRGLSLEDLDLMIAAITLENQGILVTNNTKHFSRIKGLQVENWL